MLTGLLPRDMGLGQAPGGSPTGVRPVMESLVEHLLPERLRRAGWSTAGISANHWIGVHSGFATGFDQWHQVVSERVDRFNRTGWRGRVAWGLHGVLARADDGARAAEAEIAQLIAQARADQPFLWFVNLIECHSPYLPPRSRNDLSPLQRLRAAEEARQHLTWTGILKACAGRFDISPAALERMRHLYARSVLVMDDWLARVLQRMDDAGVLDDTIVVVTSDHGENLGEGQLIGHAFSLDDRLIRVPFVSSQALAPADHVLNLADLPRLLAEAVGLEDHPWEPGPSAGDVSIAQLDPLGPPDDPRMIQFAEQWGIDDDGMARMTTGATAATDGALKLVRRGGQDLIFDLARDPLELSPEILDGAGRRDGPPIERLVAAVDTAVEPRAVSGLTSPTGPPPSIPAEELDAIEQQMKLLGYL
jgi:arylsulfatase A-like enzyme